MKQTAFDIFHPAVPAVYFASVLVLAMAAFQPVYIVATLVAAFAYSVWLRGFGNAVRTAAWQLPLLVIIALVNPLFSASGSTELFRIGVQPIYLESLAYGACMGAMLVAVMLWFSNASHVLASDKVMSLMGNTLPVVSLMISMVARLVPQIVRRGRIVSNVQQACTAAGGRAGEDAGSKDDARKLKLRENLRLTSVLMGWSMEDSLETADAMRAQGWGTAERRTTYALVRFRLRDAAALALLVLLIAGNVFLVIVACGQYQFYPKMSTLIVWWGYLPYLVLVFLPLILEALAAIRWGDKR